ncbi:hypothetical protein PSEUBRA_000071 [Kalmanozyma brasiliensis GHG001]|uniref:uncharacterized protein n=1 Tax=Kalmanozyma brasiliensis (strain GHG001) TaxID=1365824 RepID=UPI002867BA4A|nr:uncharacterized protein PSEUBRA_000071 [Kalmanozyma brasiliensis GHG001]KAF6766769.1 hypothetical protein PSEUBRA_000071 [Kalmanozyma brasiliensis GHG001]
MARDHPQQKGSSSARKRPSTGTPVQKGLVDEINRIYGTLVSAARSHEVLQVRGNNRPDSPVARVPRDTVRNWKLFLLQGIMRYMQDQERDINTIEACYKRVVRASPDGKEGIYYQISDHVAYLIHRYDLPKSTKVSGAYGEAEVSLILNDIFKRLLGGCRSDGMLQIMALVQTCFMTGLRAGSLLAADKKDESKRGMRHEDVSFTSAAPGGWTLQLLIRHIKNYNNAARHHAGQGPDASPREPNQHPSRTYSGLSASPDEARSLAYRWSQRTKDLVS